MKPFQKALLLSKTLIENKITTNKQKDSEP